jgi:hypothetical protein
LFFFLGVAETVFKASCLLLFCYGAYFIFDTVSERARAPISAAGNTVDGAANPVDSTASDNTAESPASDLVKTEANNSIEFSAPGSNEVSSSETLIVSATADATTPTAAPQSTAVTQTPSTNTLNVVAAPTPDSEQNTATVKTPGILHGNEAVDWLESLNANEFVVQFASTPDWNAISQFAGQYLPDDAVIYTYKRTPSGRPIYGVASKQTFDSLDSAQTALETIASPALKEDPWIRPVAQLLEAVSTAAKPVQ